jgi:hypothetical protein
MPAMSLPASLSVALKEWSIVCRALAEGRQIILLRKGGIHDRGGRFELEHQSFLLFPTWLHQRPELLKLPEAEALERVVAEPDTVSIAAAAEVTDIVPLTSRAAMARLDDQHIWSEELISQRFDYKPANPLYLLLVRVYLLEQSVTLENTPAFAGCRSWVPLPVSIPAASAVPVLADESYEQRRRAILGRFNGS